LAWAEEPFDLKTIGIRRTSWSNRGRQKHACPESVQPTCRWCAETLIDHPIAAMMKFQKRKGFMPADPVENHHGAKP
jgi:hypothetical protein